MMIDGIVLTPLKRIKHDKGDIFHALKCSEPSFISFGEAYFSSVNYACVKGWKIHTKMLLNLVVPVGAIKFVAYDDRPNSPTFKNFFEVVLSSDNYSRLTIPAGVWLAFRGESQGANLLLNIASIEHDPAESINCDLNEIDYNWILA